MLPRIFTRYVQRPEKNDQAICSSLIAQTSRTCQPPTFTSNGSSTKKSHWKESSCFHVQTDLSKSSIFLTSPESSHRARRELVLVTRSFYARQRRTRNTILLQRFLPPPKIQEESLQTIQSSSSKRAKTFSVPMTRLFIVQQPTGSQKELFGECMSRPHVVNCPPGGSPGAR